MKNILINVNEIESCWETADVCFIKMTSGKIWICEKKATFQTIKNSNKNDIVEIYLANKGKCGR